MELVAAPSSLAAVAAVDVVMSAFAPACGSRGNTPGSAACTATCGGGGAGTGGSKGNGAASCDCSGTDPTCF